MVTLNSLQLYIYKRAFFFENFTLSVKCKIKRTFIIFFKKEREGRDLYRTKVFPTCCLSGSVCHKNIKTETNKQNDCLRKTTSGKLFTTVSVTFLRLERMSLDRLLCDYACAQYTSTYACMDRQMLHTCSPGDLVKSQPSKLLTLQSGKH